MRPDFAGDGRAGDTAARRIGGQQYSADGDVCSLYNYDNVSAALKMIMSGEGIALSNGALPLD